MGRKKGKKEKEEEGEIEAEEWRERMKRKMKGVIEDPMFHVRAFTAIRGSIAVLVPTLLVYSDWALARMSLFYYLFNYVIMFIF